MECTAPLGSLINQAGWRRNPRISTQQMTLNYLAQTHSDMEPLKPKLGSKTCGQSILANMNALHKALFSSFQSNLHEQASLCVELNYQSLTKVITICSAVCPPVIPGWPEYPQHVDSLHFAIPQCSGQLYF